jgi:D-beta-D-heptose 7-phosphate kinase/D-beta-D-heptose 1-phosphate adenosyltransferase
MLEKLKTGRLDARMCIVGDLMLDHYIYGNCSRISPEAPVPVVEIKNESFTLGGAGNVLRNVAALGYKTDIVSVIGEDEGGGTIVNYLKENGFITSGIVKDTDRCTTIKTRVLASNHQMIRLDRESIKPIPNSVANQLLDAISEKISSYDLILISDYNKGVLSTYMLEKLFSMCKQHGVKTIVDPKGADFKRYNGANIIKPNKKEAIIATGVIIENEQTLINSCKQIQQQTGCDTVIVTLSEDGIASYDDNQLSLISTNALSVIDVTGAGDTVLASVGVALASGATLQQACEFANRAAAVVVSKIGSATTTLEEIFGKTLD